MYIGDAAAILMATIFLAATPGMPPAPQPQQARQAPQAQQPPPAPPPQLAATQNQQAFDDNRVRDLMISESIGKYSGPCACPYSMMRNGRPCATRSAHSKPGGAAPLCFRSDISDAMVRTWRARLQSR